MIDIQSHPPRRLAQAMVDFAQSCGDALERSVLVDGLLPPAVRGYRLGQEGRDDRPHMGGSDAENRAHFAAFLALLRRHASEAERPALDARIARSVRPYLARPLVPFPHRAVLQTLWEYGPLARNPLWNGFDEATRATGREHLLGLGHYFDADAGRMRTLPDNYLWITAENALLASRLLGDEASPTADPGTPAAIGRTALRRLLDKLHEEPWFDDRPPAVVVDQYAWETVAAAVRLCRAYGLDDDLERLVPVAERYLRVLRLLAREDGYAVCWGRSQGIISYGTTIYAVLALSPLLAESGRIGPRQLQEDLDLAARAFATLKRDWFDADGLTSMHRHGRAPFSYRGPHRLVGSTFGMLVKILHAARELDELRVAPAPKAPASRPAAPAAGASGWHAFRAPSEVANRRLYGLWIARSRAWHVTLPVVGSQLAFEPKVSSSYLPAPIVPFVLDVPTQQSAPYGTEFVELADGSVWAAADGCDEVVADGARLTLVWHRFLNVDTLRLGDDIGRLELAYELRDGELIRRHRFTTERGDVEHRYTLLGVALPRHERLGERAHRFRGPVHGAERTLELRVDGAVRSLGVENVEGLPAGRGFLGPLPWTVALNLPVTGGETRLVLSLTPAPPVVL